MQVAALVPLGAASVTFAAGVNSSLQLAVGDALRGRVMALYSVVFLGSTPIGAPIVGWLARRPARAPGCWPAAPPRCDRGVGARRASPTPRPPEARTEQPRADTIVCAPGWVAQLVRAHDS